MRAPGVTLLQGPLPPSVGRGATGTPGGVWVGQVGAAEPGQHRYEGTAGPARDGYGKGSHTARCESWETVTGS